MTTLSKLKWYYRMRRIRVEWKEKGYTILAPLSYFSFSTKERSVIRETFQRLSAMNKVVRIEKRVAETMMDYPFSFRK